MVLRWFALGLAMAVGGTSLLSARGAAQREARGPAAAPQAGGLTALPERAMEGVPLANGGFEQRQTGWRAGPAEAWDVAAQGPGDGGSALRLDCGRPTPYVPRARQGVAGAGPGIYRLSLRVRVQGVRGEGPSAAGVRAGVEYVLQDGRRAWETTPVLTGTRDWARRELWVLVPDGTRAGSLAVTLERYGTTVAGEAFFDDVTLERSVPPAVEAFLRYPNYRGFLPAEGPARVKLWVRVNRQGLGEPVRVEARPAGGGQAVASVTLPAGATEQVVELDARAWPPGRYLVTASAGEHRYPAYAIEKLAPGQRRSLATWFDEHHVLHIDGRPTFPIGLYNTTLRFPVVDEGELARVRKMAEAPVNFHINYLVWANDLATRRRYLAAIRESGAWFLDTVNNAFPESGGRFDFPIFRELMPEAGGSLETQEVAERYWTRLAEAMRDVPGHAGWYVMDERSFAEVPRHFRQLQVLRSADPGRFTYGVSNRPEEVACWRDALDVFGLDPYPLMNMRAGRPLSEVGAWTRAGVEATQGSRPVWTVIQFFQGWSTDRWPTEAELRTMSLMAIAEGARGVFYWSYGNRALASVRDEKQREEYWQRLVRVTRELRSLEPALVAADAPQAVRAVSEPRLRWRARRAGGKVHVFAYLPADKRPDDPAAATPVTVEFTFANGTRLTRPFRPDEADWFAVPE